MIPHDGWQIRRPKGRRIYTGLSRARVERALRVGTLRPDDLALPPGSHRWMTVVEALVAQIPGQDEAVSEVTVPDWVPLHREGRLLKTGVDQEDPAEMEMMPMIDITTLLLIFFLLGGVFMLQTQVALPQAETGSPSPSAELQPVGILIDRDPDDPTQFHISLEAESDNVSLEELVAWFEKTLKDGELPEVILKAHRRVPFGFVRRAMATLSDAGVNQIRVAVEEAR